MEYFVPLFLYLAIFRISSASYSREDKDNVFLPVDSPIDMIDRITSGKVISSREKVHLHTTMGTITGLREPSAPPHVSNTHHFAFRGIPYAKPPIDDLRFTDPVDLEGAWPGGSLDATKFGSFCLQFNVYSQKILGSENCLFLNIYTPVIPDKTKEEKVLLPVLVFIHGGAYIRGSSSGHGAEKLLARDLVVVTFNYRLGALGFLSTGDSILPGNYGTLDQVSALRWVRRYIAEFGGDPKQVTIGGFSVGAVAVHLHMHSPLSKGLFHQAIMMSGSGSCNFAIQEHPETPAKLLATKLSCPTSPSSALSSCIASKDYKEIIKAQASIYMLEFIPVWFAVVVDDGLRPTPLLPAPLEELEVQSVPTIVGTVPHEALLFAANGAVLSKDIGSPSALYDIVVPLSFTPWDDPDTGPAMHRVAKSFYFSSYAKISKDILLEEFTEALTDSLFTRCLWDTAANLTNIGSPVYMYLMTHRDPGSDNWAMPLYQQLWKMGYISPLLKEGVSHGDDLLHLFAFPFMSQGTENDNRVADIIVSVVTNFVNTGEPRTGVGSLADLPLWTPVIKGQPVSYYNINVNPSMVHKPYKIKERNFWKTTIPMVVAAASSKSAKDQWTGSSPDLCPLND